MMNIIYDSSTTSWKDTVMGVFRLFFVFFFLTPFLGEERKSEILSNWAKVRF